MAGAVKFYAAMQQDDDRPGAAGVLVLDRSRRKFNLVHDTALPSSTGVAQIIHMQSARLIQWERQRAWRLDSGERAH